MKQKGTLVALLLCLLLLLSTGAAFAGSSGSGDTAAIGSEGPQRSISTTSLSFERDYSLHGISTATCACNVTADWVKAVYQLQMLYNGSYVDVGNTVTVYQYNTSVFAEERNWTVSISGTYRVKVYFYERYDGATKGLGWLYSQAASL